MTRATQGKVAPEVVATAADWFTRLQEDDAVEQDFQEWQRWLNESAEHQRAYRELEQAWRLIGDVNPTPWTSRKELEGDPSAAAPAVAARIERRKPPVIFWALAATMLLFLSVAALISNRGETYSTRTAEQRSVRLPDGSRVTLGAESKMTPMFTGPARRVVLNFGEAYFEVAHDPRRPFTVRVGSNEIRAVGTAFNVRATKDRVLVSVTEGRVAVVSGRAGEKTMVVSEKTMVVSEKTMVVRTPAESAEVLLSAGEQAAITRAGTIEEKSLAPSAVTWLNGRFEYQGEELRHVIDDLNRYTDRRIVLTDESLGDLRYSGTVFPDHLDEWLQGIGGALPVAVREAGERREIIPQH